MKKDGLKIYRCSKSKFFDKVAENEAAKTDNIEEKELNNEKEEIEEQVQPAPVIIERRLSPEEILLGKLKEFVYMKSGQWNHEDWIWLLNRPDIKEFGMSENDIGRLLEEEKARYWLQRNNY